MATAPSEMAQAQASPPLSVTRLKQIATDVCDSALADAKAYNPAAVDEWNSKIVNNFLQALVSETSNSSSSSPSISDDQSPPQFKFAVNSIIIQHPLSRTSSTSTGTSTTTTNTDADPDAGADPSNPISLDSLVEKSVPMKRGMHSASGAYWNNAKDGMWTHKYEGVDSKGMDVVLLVMWIAI